MDLSAINLSRKQVFIVVAILLILITAIVLVFLNLLPSAGTTELTRITLWGSTAEPALEKVASGYAGARGVEVNYVVVPDAEYRTALLNALAAGEGPDVFLLGNRDIPQERGKLAPAGPAQAGIAKFRELFPTAVEQDFVLDGELYALPLYLDTMVLLYNKDFFDQAGVVEPPKTWDAFRAMIPKLRTVSDRGQIVKAGAAVGGSERTIHSAVDLLHFLMLQNGTEMVDPNRAAASFAEGPGLEAFEFYLQFADAGSPYYTWNENQGRNSLDAFAGGTAAMILDYGSATRYLQTKNPFLRIGIAPAPQIAGKEAIVSYPRYQGLAVSKQSKVQKEAWNFVSYAATDVNAQIAYLNESGRPPALRSLIEQVLTDPELAVFARQALTARSWYNPNELRVRDVFDETIRSAATGRVDPRTALSQAQDQVSQLINLIR